MGSIVDLPSTGTVTPDSGGGVAAPPDPTPKLQSGQIVDLDSTTSKPMGRYNFESIKSLLKSTDSSLPPDAYDKLAFVSMAESAGDPNNVNPTSGAAGLFQINPHAHGQGNWKDVSTNVKKAIELYKARVKAGGTGLEDWEDSRTKGAGGGWGQFVDAQGGGGKIVDLPSSTATPNAKLPQGGMAALLAGKKPQVQQAGFGIEGLAPIADAYKKGTQSAIKEGHKLTDTSRNMMSEAWDKIAGPHGYVARPTEGLMNALGTAQRAVDAGIQTQDRLDTHPEPGKIPAIEDVKAMLGAAIHPEQNDKIVSDLEQQFGKHFGFDVNGLVHQGGAFGKFSKIALDIIVETGTDPLTYVPIADAVSIPGRIARIAASNHVSVAAASHVMDVLAKYPAVEELSKSLWNAAKSSNDSMHISAKKIGDLFNSVFKDKRTELDSYLTTPGKNIYMATESAVEHGKSQLAQEHGKILDRDYRTIRDQGGSGAQQQADLASMFRYGGHEGQKQALRSGYVPTEIDRKTFAKPHEYLSYSNSGTPLYNIPKGLSSEAAEHYRMDPSAFNVHLSASELADKAKSLGIPTTRLVKQRFELAREALGREQVAHKMAEMVRAHPDLSNYTAANTASLEEHFRDTVANAREIGTGPGKHFIGMADALEHSGYGKTMKAVQRVFTTGIKTNFAPHGVFNVGVITAARGGLGTAARGLGYGLHLMTTKPLLDAAGHDAESGHLQSLINRVHANGGIGTSFTGDMFHLPDQIREIPGWGDAISMLGKGSGFNTYFKAMQHGLESFETGYRASYLEHLDHIMGPSTSAEMEMAKGAKVLNDIGDYANKTAAVKFLGAMGGLFVNFRASIAPAAIVNAIKHQGVLSSTKGMRSIPVTPLMLRIQHEINEAHGAPAGYDATWGGPIGDTAGALTPQYWMSPSTVGPIASGAMHAADQMLNKRPSPVSPMQAMESTLDATGVPGFSPYSEPPKVAPWLVLSHYITGSYLQRKPSRAADRFERTYKKRTAEE